MKKAVGILAGLLVLGTPVFILNMGSKSVPINELRPARLAECPPLETNEEIAAAHEKCPAGIRDFGEFCVCLTKKDEGELTGEETTVPVAKRRRMEVCELVDELSQQKHLATRYPLSTNPLDAGCILVLDNIKFPGVSFHNVPTGIEARLEEKCGFSITPDSWRACPECLHPSYGKKCEDLYPVEEVTP